MVVVGGQGGLWHGHTSCWGHVVSPLRGVPPSFLSFFTRNDVSMSLLETQTAGIPVPKSTLPSYDHHRVPGGLNLLLPIEIT